MFDVQDTGYGRVIFENFPTKDSTAQVNIGSQSSRGIWREYYVKKDGKVESKANLNNGSDGKGPHSQREWF